ncbi:CLUMA_CG001897, isoform A [Clunio marinus]|uniref:CLUMA_CG001897, isoform A n=1 Tax=Clunio marinus TaxID=568069 RepID=A0A1J1HJ87_9DIPT|nr:CLUMA_CG001897, isoform A [Clunio marinus]
MKSKRERKDEQKRRQITLNLLKKIDDTNQMRFPRMKVRSRYQQTIVHHIKVILITLRNRHEGLK